MEIERKTLEKDEYIPQYQKLEEEIDLTRDLANNPEFIQAQADAFMDCRECFEKTLLKAAWPNLTNDQKISASNAISTLNQKINEENDKKSTTLPLKPWHFPLLNRLRVIDVKK